MTDLARAAAAAGVPTRPLVVLRHRGFAPAKLDARTAAWAAELLRRGASHAAIADVLDRVALGFLPTGYLVCAGRDAESRKCRWVHVPDEVEASRFAGPRPRIIALSAVHEAVEARLQRPSGASVQPRGSRARKPARG